MNHNQIVMSLSCSDLEKENIINNINLFLNGELKGRRENLSFVELEDNTKLIKLKDWFIYAILMIGTEPISNAISNAIKEKPLTLKFIDLTSNNELYSLNSNRNHLLDDFKHLSKKEIAEKFIKEIKEKNLKQQLSKMFTEKLQVRNFARNKFKELDNKIDSLHQEKDFSTKDVKNLSIFLSPVSEALQNNKKPIIREHIRRLILAESAINKEIDTGILNEIFDVKEGKKKKFGIIKRVSRWALTRATFGLWAVVVPNGSDDDDYDYDELG